MTNDINNINCSRFEELLTDYIDKTLDATNYKSVASHALACPLCHELLNDVKVSLDACREMATPTFATAHMTKLEARILSATTPEVAMTCEDFEGYLTDYLDGFLPAQTFHRWERHAALCTGCEDMPGMVVRSIATLYTYKSEELPLPAGLHARILESTSHMVEAQEAKTSWITRAGEWLEGLRFPITMPQLAPVAMMVMFAFLVFSQTVSADGSIASVYERGFELAEQTYQESSQVLGAKPVPADLNNGGSNQ
jgi:anti-sigma factor RsiW